MTYLLEIPDAEANTLTAAIQQLSTDLKLTPLSGYAIARPPLPPTAAQLAALAALRKPLQPGEETAEELEQRIYADRRDQPREIEL